MVLLPCLTGKVPCFVTGAFQQISSCYLPVAQSRVSKQIKPGGENSWCCVQAGRGLLDQSSPIKHEESLFLLSEVPQVSVAACAVRKKMQNFLLFI